MSAALPQCSRAPAPAVSMSLGSAAHTPPPTPPPTSKEEHTNGVTRFAGNLLISRGARAVVTSTTSFAKLPLNLSPWGDNNPVTLPNVRPRDIVFAAASYFGGDIILNGLGETLTWSGQLLQEAISEVVDSAVDETLMGPLDKKKMLEAEGLLERMTTQEHFVLETTTVKTIRASVKHNLMGVNARLQYFQPRPCPLLSRGSIAKGWFCPYLYASGRTPHIARSEDFSIAQLSGPALNADSQVAHFLYKESAAVLSFCDAQPSSKIGSDRMVVLFAGISPWRLHAWSQSRIPDGARLQFHLIDGCPALVIPVLPGSPVLAWSSVTMRQMHSHDYIPADHYTEIMRGLVSIVNVPASDETKKQHYKILMANLVKMIIRGVVHMKNINPKIWEVIDPDRSGLLMFRY